MFLMDLIWIEIRKAAGLSHVCSSAAASNWMLIL
jgi:hypothetical protein